MIKTSTENIVNSYFYLEELGREKVPVALALRLKRIIRQVREDVQEFEQVRKTLIDKYVVTNAEGIPDYKDDESKRLFEEEIATVLQTEVEILGQPIKPEELGKVEISADAADRLEWLFPEEVENEMALNFTKEVDSVN